MGNQTDVMTVIPLVDLRAAHAQVAAEIQAGFEDVISSTAFIKGEVAAAFAEGFARVNLLGQLVTWHVNWAHWPASWGWSWPVAWFGLGLIIFARVMRISAGMRADLEGTV